MIKGAGMNLEEWLQSLKLSQYAGVMAEQAIDLDVLPEITEADLIAMGIPLGDRKRML